ncbi:synaptic defective enhancer 1-like isoform X2 [Melospiza georgiana]|uniref:synaptic defective enhancer 1-like isoform X2 n=1 Tax=Melospiza georgiana TaxID=44398 RepID=UPI0025AB96FB|nr:synaptic defective enhancer 1-like isoform X2 [Melospiza georgiana]
MTQPLFQHRLPFRLAPFQKPSPSTPFFPAFLLPPPPRLTVTLKQPPLPTPRFPPPPQTPSSGPWDAGELWRELPVSISKRGAAGSGPLFSPVLVCGFLSLQVIPQHTLEWHLPHGCPFWENES